MKDIKEEIREKLNPLDSFVVSHSRNEVYIMSKELNDLFQKKLAEKKKCGKSYYPDCNSCPYKHNCETLYINDTIDECFAYFKQILEDSKEKKWCKHSIYENIKGCVDCEVYDWDETGYNNRIDKMKKMLEETK